LTEPAASFPSNSSINSRQQYSGSRHENLPLHQQIIESTGSTYGAFDQKNIVATIVKASQLLELFSFTRLEISLKEFAAETQFNKTTIYRLLQTLVATDWLIRSSTGGYRLGIRCLMLGAIAQSDFDLRSKALPFMQTLSDEFGDTTFLMVPRQHEAVIVETANGGNRVRLHGVGVGTTLPYNVAAGPIVLGAFSEHIESKVLSEERRKYTRYTLVTEDALRQKFADVRKLGYAFSCEDYIEEIAALGAPIFGPSGEPIASISIGGPSHHFVEPTLSMMVQRVCEAAHQLSIIASSGIDN